MLINSLNFGVEYDNRVAGELLIKLQPQANREISSSLAVKVPPLINVSPNRFGLSDLDSTLDQLGVMSIARLHTPFSSNTLSVDTAAATAIGMDSTYRLRFADPTADLRRASEALSALSEIVEVSPNYFRFAAAVPNDPMLTAQWGLAAIKCLPAWQNSTGSSSIIVAVVDSGVDLDHPDLRDNIVDGQDLVDLTGVVAPDGIRFEGDFLSLDNDAQDEVGHGTHVGGTIAAMTNNGVGVAGVAWICRLMPVRVLARLVSTSDGSVTGGGIASDIAAGIRWASDHGAHIVNLSLGGYNETFVERDAVKYAISKDVLIVAAMGNDGTTQRFFPSAYPGVVAVGSIQRDFRRSSFSNRGSHQSLVAPGVDIQSTDWDNIYSTKSGTSMAAPHVSGVAVLVLSVNPRLTNEEVVRILHETARPLRDDPNDPVPNDGYGFGVVNAEAAVRKAQLEGGLITPSGPDTLLFYDSTNGQAEVYQVDQSGNFSLIARHSNWRTTWTIIVRSGPDTLLFYDSTNGQAEVYQVDQSGNFSLIARHSNWRTTWGSTIALGSSDLSTAALPLQGRGR